MLQVISVVNMILFRFATQNSTRPTCLLDKRKLICYA